MKNLTEFPGFLLRRADAVRVEKLKELRVEADAKPEPQIVPPTEAQVETADEVSAESAQPAPEAADKPTDEPQEASDAKTESVGESDGDPPKASRPDVDEEALAAAVGEVLKISEERLTYLMGALKAVGRKGIDKVRQVRVFKGENAPAGAFSIDDLHFVVDRIAPTNSGKSSRSGKDGKGRGRDNKGRGRDNKGGGGGGGYAGKGGRGFDSMARDEKPGEVPSGGLGWSLERAPGSDRKEGRGRGKPGKKGPRRGRPGDKPGGKPGDNRNRGRGNRSGGKKPPMPEVVVKAPTVAPTEKK